MPCIPVPGGIVCTRGARTAPCSVPGCGRRHTKLCDFPIATRDGTCDAMLCDAHATRVAPNKDYCPPHAKHVEAPAPTKPTLFDRLQAKART